MTIDRAAQSRDLRRSMETRKQDYMSPTPLAPPQIARPVPPTADLVRTETGPSSPILLNPPSLQLGMRFSFGSPPLLLALVVGTSAFAPPSGSRGASSARSCHPLLRRAPVGSLSAKPTPPGPREGEREEDLPEDMGERKRGGTSVCGDNRRRGRASCS